MRRQQHPQSAPPICVGRPSRYLVQAHKELSELVKQRGDTDGALQVLERAISVQERVGRPLA